MKRPECFEFAMDFLGEPEDAEIRGYIEGLEGKIKELEELLALEQRVSFKNASAIADTNHEPGSWP